MDPAVALNVGTALAVSVLGFGALLAAVSVASWIRLRQTKLLVVGGAFVVLAVKGGIALAGAWSERTVDLAPLGLDALVLAFLYASVAMR